ncbi:MAG: hypothetical protein J6O73_16020 [Lachnospiraceae bacterium]|nr:hypothetical protein [Lachnospiraceae bacterium]
MDDLIYRSAALRSLGGPPLVWTGSDYEIGMRWQWGSDFNAIKNVPPAQPDVPDMNVGDIISRQAAIKGFDCCELTPDGGIDVNYAIDFLNQLPSAQPLEVLEAYYKGKCDGIKECTARLKKVYEEFVNG